MHERSKRMNGVNLFQSEGIQYNSSPDGERVADLQNLPPQEHRLHSSGGLLSVFLNYDSFHTPLLT